MTRIEEGMKEAASKKCQRKEADTTTIETKKIFKDSEAQVINKEEEEEEGGSDLDHDGDDDDLE